MGGYLVERFQLFCIIVLAPIAIAVADELEIGDPRIDATLGSRS